MTRLVLVDWLGRGGIAQVSAAWVLELSAAGRDSTREGRTSTPALVGRHPH